MKVKEIYICELCGAEYTGKDAAIKCEYCECSHHIPKKVVLHNNDLSYDEKTAYPREVVVIFDNGASCTYYSKSY